jgi:hypothetical protein
VGTNGLVSKPTVVFRFFHRLTFWDCSYIRVTICRLSVNFSCIATSVRRNTETCRYG